MDVYLIKTEVVANNNKFYMMHQEEGAPTFTVTYGRVGTGGVRKSYPMRSWDSKYQEKLKKGYKDITHLKASNSSKALTFKGEGADIMEELIKLANQTVKRNYTISPGAVTQQMVGEAEKLIHKLIEIAPSEMEKQIDIVSFNKVLVDLFNVLPRKMNAVENYIAKNSEDCIKIVQREYDLLDTMKSLIPAKEEETFSNNDETDMFKALGLNVKNASIDEIEMVKSLVDFKVSAKVARVWRVTNNKTQKCFDNYVEKHEIKATKLLWHGSGNENWYSIIKTGLRIRPSGARYTGSMFGDGIYFATKASKSFNYTSYRGTYWRGGTESKSFMALFETAFGNPLDVHKFSSYVNHMDYTKLRSKGNFHCLFAHKGNMLKNDEIVFYRPDQVTIKYLVEFV